MSSREQFEAWAEKNGHDIYRSGIDGAYYFQSTQWSWDIWQAATNTMEDKYAALTAENDNLVNFITDKYWCASDCLPETPSTDAFLAEVLEQIWIEGSEPAEFGRYWVRYETDVGPQYCSAKWMEHNFCAGSDTNIHKIWLADHSRSINSLKGVTHYTMLPEPIEGGAK